MSYLHPNWPYTSFVGDGELIYLVSVYDACNGDAYWVNIFQAEQFFASGAVRVLVARAYLNLAGGIVVLGGWMMDGSCVG